MLKVQIESFTSVYPRLLITLMKRIFSSDESYGNFDTKEDNKEIVNCLKNTMVCLHTYGLVAELSQKIFLYTLSC